MNLKSLSPEVNQIWRVVKTVQMTMGFTMGLYLFTYGPYLYNSFGGSSNPKTAMLLAGIWLAVQNALIAVFEVPTGAIGDAIGRKKTVLWSLICRTIFFIFMALISISNYLVLSFTLALAAAVSFGLAYTFYSGTFTAWCVDSLRQKAPELGYEHILSRGFTCNFLTQIVGAVIGIFCYTNDVSYLGFLLGALACIPCLTICAGEMSEEYSAFLNTKQVKISAITRRVGEIIGLGYQTFRNSKMILWLTLVFASFLFLDNVICYLWPVHLRTHILEGEQNFYWIAIAVGILVVSALGSHSLTWLSRRWNKNNGFKTHNTTLRRWLVATCALCSLSVLALGWLTMRSYNQFPLFIAVVLMVEYAYGLVHPCYETLVNNHIPDASSDERATILSFGSMARSVLILFLSIPSSGKSAETTTIGWMIPASLLIVFTLIANFSMKRKEKELPEVVSNASPETTTA